MKSPRIGQALTTPASIFSGTKTSAIDASASRTTSRILSSNGVTQSQRNHKSCPIVINPSLTAPNNNSTPNPAPTHLSMNTESTLYNPPLAPSYTTPVPLTTNYLLLSVKLAPDKPLQPKSPITTSPNSSTTSLPTPTTALSTTQATLSSLASPMTLTLT